MATVCAGKVAPGIQGRVDESASFAFMLPLATGLNAVIFGSGQLTIRQMAREGIVLNLIGVVVITSVVFVLLS